MAEDDESDSYNQEGCSGKSDGNRVYSVDEENIYAYYYENGIHCYIDIGVLRCGDGFSLEKKVS